MCDPATLAVASFAIAATSTMVAYAGQQAAASAKTAQYNQNYVDSLAAARNDQLALTTRQTQEQEQTSQKLQMSQTDQAQRASETSAAAAQGGVGGLSVGSLLSDVAAKGDANRTTIETNYEDAAQQLQSQKVATNDTAENRINSMQPGVEPSAAAAGLNIAGEGLSAYNGYSKRMQ